VDEIIHNSKEKRMVEEIVGISYESDPEKAIQIIKEALESFEEISKEPPPQIGIQEFGDSSINIGLRYWIPSNTYFKILFQANLSVYKHLKAKNIEIPFPQKDVHIVSRSQDGQSSTK
jgi:small conductance mechanosensitive channel